MTGALFLGTSGYAYKDWKGGFYPQDLKDADMLRHYAERLRSVEINYTFRRYPTDRTTAGWVEQTPEGFRFALKANQRITHTLRLADADEAVSAFLDRAKGLGRRLGPILFQCPPSLRFDRRLIESFVGYLPPTFRYAMEFRHPSWEEARPILADQGVAWCVADGGSGGVARPRAGGRGTSPASEPPGTNGSGIPAEIPAEPFAYLRLRRDEYDDDELAAWASRIRRALDGGRDVHCYVKHEAAAAPERAARLLRLVSG